MSQYVIIRDNSVGNEFVGEMWQETKIFPGDATIEDVMEWACDGYIGVSKKHIQITRPDNESD